MSLARLQFTVTDSAGNVVSGAHVEIRSEVAGQPLAATKSDRAGASAQANPSDTDSSGYFYCYLLGGSYYVRVYTGPSGAPLTEHIDRYVAVGLNAESDSIASRTQRVITAAGTDTMTTSDAQDIIFNKTVGAASRIILPLSSAVTDSKKIVDGKFDALTNNITVVPKRPNTFTVTLASPGVFTKVAHGLAVDQPISLETTGSLYTGLAADTQYYIKTVPTADTFTIAATVGGAAINTSGSQSGVHTYGTDTIMGDAKYVIDGNGGSILLSPRADGSGWYS